MPRTVREDDEPRNSWGQGWAGARPMPIRSDYVKTQEPDPGIWAYLAQAKRAGPRSRAKIDLGGAALNVLGAIESAKRQKIDQELGREKLQYEDAWKRYSVETEMAKEREREANIAGDNARADEGLGLQREYLGIAKKNPGFKAEALDIQRDRLDQSAKSEAERAHLREQALAFQGQGLALREENLKRQKESDAALAKYREDSLAGRPEPQQRLDPVKKLQYDARKERFKAKDSLGGNDISVEEQRELDIRAKDMLMAPPARPSQLGSGLPAQPPTKEPTQSFNSVHKPPAPSAPQVKWGRGPDGKNVKFVLQAGQWVPATP